MWEAIQANRRRSAYLIWGMVVVLLVLGWTGGELLAPGAGPIGLLLALGIWGVMMFLYFTNAERILLHGTGARELSHEDSPQLFNIVDEMKLASGLPYRPRIFLIDDPSPNAFAIGRKPDQSAIAVTTGLMYRLNRDELQGVIAHEIGHLRNEDVKFMTLAAVLLGTIVILSVIMRRALWYGGRGRRRSSSRGGGQGQAIILIVGLVFAILGPLMAQLLYFACSRKREYLADASGAQFTRYPEGLASALEKISQAGRGVSFANQVTAPMFIVNPLAAAGRQAASLFSTHPPTHERIRVLRSMGGASLADYEQAYQRALGGHLIGNRSLRTAPAQPIRGPSNEGPIGERRGSHDLAHRAQGYLPVTCACGLEISVPEGYEQEEIRCIRCGSVLPVPAAHQIDAAAKESLPTGEHPLAAAPPLLYTRVGQGWESFRCQCGRTVQISPAFRAPSIRCKNCGRQIEVHGTPVAV